MGKSTPAPPDPIATANAQGAANNASAVRSTQMNRYSTIAPGVKTNWINPDADGVSQTQVVSLDAPNQALYDQNLGNSNAASGKAGTIIAGLDPNGVNIAGLPKLAYDIGQGGQLIMGGSGDDVMTGGAGTDYNFGQDSRKAEDAVYNRYARTLDPQQAAETRATDDKLANMGLPIGSEAYNYEKNRVQAGQDKARQDARDASVTAGNAVQQQIFGQGLSRAGLRNSAQQQEFGENMSNQNLIRQTLAQLLGASSQQMPGAPTTAQQGIAPVDVAGITQGNANTRAANAASQNQSTNAAIGAAASIAASAF